jgi:hypothetical protein
MIALLNLRPRVFEQAEHGVGQLNRLLATLLLARRPAARAGRSRAA